MSNVAGKRSLQRCSMSNARDPERIQTVVIGAGQAGLSVGYHLTRRGLSSRDPRRERAGWRQLAQTLGFPAAVHARSHDGLAGMAFPGSPTAFPTKNEMADFLRGVCHPVQTPDQEWREGGASPRHGRGHLVSAGIRRSRLTTSWLPCRTTSHTPCARVQQGSRSWDRDEIHSIDYRNPSQLQEGAISS